MKFLPFSILLLVTAFIFTSNITKYELFSLSEPIIKTEKESFKTSVEIRKDLEEKDGIKLGNEAPSVSIYFLKNREKITKSTGNSLINYFCTYDRYRRKYQICRIL